MTNLQRRVWNLTEELLFDDNGISTAAVQELVGIIAKVNGPKTASFIIDALHPYNGRFHLDKRYREKFRNPVDFEA